MSNDNLDDLPVNDSTVLTPREETTINKLSSNKETPKSNGKLLKQIAYIAILFVILANPYIDKLLCNIPNCNNPLILFIIKLVVFLIGLFFILKFMK